MNAGQAARELMRGVEQGGVAIRYLSGQGEQPARNRAADRRLLTHLLQLHGFLRPASPVAQQTAYDMHGLDSVSRWNVVFAYQIEHNGIIVSGVDGQLAGSADLRHGTDH